MGIIWALTLQKSIRMSDVCVKGHTNLYSYTDNFILRNQRGGGVVALHQTNKIIVHNIWVLIP